MKLIHSGKVLKDEDTIESCNIKPNAFLVVMISKVRAVTLLQILVETLHNDIHDSYLKLQRHDVMILSLKRQRKQQLLPQLQLQLRKHQKKHLLQHQLKPLQLLLLQHRHQLQMKQLIQHHLLQTQQPHQKPQQQQQQQQQQQHLHQLQQLHQLHRHHQIHSHLKWFRI